MRPLQMQSGDASKCNVHKGHTDRLSNQHRQVLLPVFKLAAFLVQRIINWMVYPADICACTVPEVKTVHQAS